METELDLRNLGARKSFRSLTAAAVTGKSIRVWTKAVAMETNGKERGWG